MPTFTPYDPAIHTNGAVLAAVLTPPPGLSVVPGSVQLRWGNVSASFPIDEFPDLPDLPDLPGFPGTVTGRSISFYDGSITSLGVGAGLLLSTGAALPPAANTQPEFGEMFDPPAPGTVLLPDAQLQAIANAAFAGAGTITDTTSLVFQVNVTDPTIRGLRFDVVFASDEYPEFANSSYVDIAAVIVNGANYALFNQQATQPLSVIKNNIDLGNFRDNANSTIPIEYDGVSRSLSVIAPVNQGVNTIKIGVADTGDAILDSALFVSRIQPTDFAGFGLAPVITLAPPAQGPTPAAQDQSGNQIYTFTPTFKGALKFGPATGTGSGANGGNDVVDGSNAFVAIKFDSPLAALLGLELLPDGIRLVLPYGTKVLNDVERIGFNDLLVAFDTAYGETTWNTFALLKAVLGNAPSTATLSQWVLEADKTADPVALAGKMLDAYLPGITPVGLVTHLCQKLLAFTPDPALAASLAGLIGPAGAVPTDDAFLYAVASIEDINSMVGYTGIPIFLDPAAFAATW